MLVLLLLFVPGSFAASLASVEADYAVVGGKVVVSYLYVFSDAKDGSFTLSLPKDASAVSVKLGGLRLDPAITETDYSRELEIQVEEPANEVLVSFITSSFLESTYKDFFLVDLKVPFQSERARVVLSLPEGSLVESSLESRQPAIFPDPEGITTQAERPTIEWLIQPASPEQGIPLLVVFSRNQGLEALTPILAAVIAAVASAAAYLLYKRRKTPSPETEAGLHLIEPEKAVVELLSKAEDRALGQKELLRQTGFSKARMSRILRNLEERKVIEKIPRGNTNTIRLI